mmetsp:Transcript_124074/g.333185  ORF Transcript_124074/g.333185 Transcript_124074/m.333185 type:complete len:466 (-) Transcript_124074:206-1603(-)
MAWRSALWLTMPCACRALWGALDSHVGSGEQLPSWKAGHNTTKLVRDVRWWAHVGDHVYVAPSESNYLSQHIGDYYVAMGSESALTDVMRQRRVGGHGRWHIFHLPEGPDTMEFNRRGDRRSAFSALVQLRAGDVMPATFPKYNPSECEDSAGERFDQMEKSAVDSITAGSFLEQLQKIVNIKDDTGTITRSYANPDASHAAQAFVKKEFESMGLKSCLQRFTYQGTTHMANVVAVIPGTGEGTLTVGAHYDSRPFKGAAPGAEDNGSGLAAMLSVARAFAKQGLKPKRTVYFVGFAGEEPGLVGSYFFAQTLKEGKPLPQECGAPAGGSFVQGSSFMQDFRARGASDHDAIALDEVGWVTSKYDRQTVNLESYDWTTSIMDHMACASRRHNGDALEVVHSSHPFGSDHMSFLEQGMKAVLVINGDDEAYPNYHMSSDTIDNVNTEYAAKISKMVMGAVMRLAGQ